MPTRSLRRGARVDEWARLESVCTLPGTVGSNPTPSAILTAGWLPAQMRTPSRTQTLATGSPFRLLAP